VVEGDLLWRSGQFVPAVRPRVEVMKPARRRIISTLSRNGLGFPAAGDLATLERAPAGMAGQLQDGPDAVLVFIEKRMRTALDLLPAFSRRSGAP